MYIDINGKRHNTDIDIENRNMWIKVNLPLTQEDEESGNGEGIWASISLDSLEKYSNGEMNEDFKFVAIALNDSVYYPKFKYGDMILCSGRKNKRPVAIRKELIEKYCEPISKKEKDELLKKVMKGNCICSKYREGTL